MSWRVFGGGCGWGGGGHWVPLVVEGVGGGAGGLTVSCPGVGGWFGLVLGLLGSGRCWVGWCTLEGGVAEDCVGEMRR